MRRVTKNPKKNPIKIWKLAILSIITTKMMIILLSHKRMTIKSVIIGRKFQVFLVIMRL